VLRWLKFSYMSWTNDDKGFFYERYPAPPKGKEITQQDIGQSLYYHRLGTAQKADRLIYARADRPNWYITAGVSENGRWLLVVLNKGTAPENELYVADMADPLKPDVAAPLKPLYAGNDAMYSPIDVRNGELYLETNLGAPRRRIVAARLSDPVPARWRTVVPEGKGVIESVSFAGRYLVVDRIVDAVSRFDLYDTDGKPAGSPQLPGPGTIMGFDGLQGSNVLYYGFSLFLSPASSYRYDLRTRKTETVFWPNLKFDALKYETREIFYPSKDGTMVPMFILAEKNLTLDGTHPTILLGYGGFGDSYLPFFKPIYAAWLEMGGVYAVANIRGGDTYGEAWHRAGMLDKKQNVFDDFAWAAKYLIERGYTSARHLGIQGKSNGGLLVGASITQNPALFGAAHVDRGVLDMLRFQHFSSGPGVVPEYGSSDDPKAFRWLYAYSPLHNVKNGTCYPPTLITTSWDDDRVVPMHSFKFAAAMQRAQGCRNPVLLLTAQATAHSYMPTDKAIAQTADVLAFEGTNLGMTPAPIPRLH
jgi:prolyl oligopeptidase